jgi:hypothetical protein
MGDDFYSVLDLISRYDVHMQTLRNWANDPRVAFPRPTDTGLWQAADVAAWEARCRGPFAGRVPLKVRRMLHLER